EKKNAEPNCGLAVIQFSGNKPAGTEGLPVTVVPPGTLIPTLALRSTVPRSPGTPTTTPDGPDPTPLNTFSALATVAKSPLARASRKFELNRKCWDPRCVVPFTGAHVAVAFVGSHPRTPGFRFNPMNIWSNKATSSPLRVRARASKSVGL